MSTRPKRKAERTTEVPNKAPRKWADSEIEVLLTGLMRYGHKNVKKIQELLPRRSTECIKTYIRTAHDKALKMTKHSESIESWIGRCSSGDGTPWTDCLQVAQVVKYLSVDGLLENHPLPSSCGGVDFSLAYRLIYQALMGYPIQPVNKATADFVLKSLTELEEETKKQVGSFKNLQKFLGNKVKIQDSNPAVIKPNTSDDNFDKICEVKKPLRVYQRKRSNVVNNEVVPSLKISIEEKEGSSGAGPSKDFRITVEGSNSTKSTTVNVPVATKKKINKDEEELLKSSSYNPLKIPEEWLEEPFHLNFVQKS